MRKYIKTKNVSVNQQFAINDIMKDNQVFDQLIKSLFDDLSRALSGEIREIKDILESTIENNIKDTISSAVQMSFNTLLKELNISNQVSSSFGNLMGYTANQLLKDD